MKKRKFTRESWKADIKRWAKHLRGKREKDWEKEIEEARISWEDKVIKENKQ